MEQKTLRAAAENSVHVNQEVLGKVRSRMISVSKAQAGSPQPSNVQEADPFETATISGKLAAPPFDLFVLTTLPENSSELNQCVEAMETNIDGTGHRFVSRLRIAGHYESEHDEKATAEGEVGDVEADGADPKKMPPSLAPEKAPEKTPKKVDQRPFVRKAQKLSPELQEIADAEAAEKVRLVNFFTYATSESFIRFRRKLRRDLETTGNAYFEVLRNGKGEVCGFNHAPSYQMRLGRFDGEPMEYDRKILELQPDGSVEVKKIREWKRFRRYAQTFGGNRLVWFKEFGDPRTLNKNTGEFDSEAAEKKASDGERATEMIHISLYSPRSPYGLPRYIGNLLSIYGDRAAEEINYITFRNNNIPSMAILVSNGQLTDGTIDRIQSFVDSQIQGSDNYSKFLIIEAESILGDGEDGGQVKTEIKQLTENQHRDSLFQNYSTNNQDKIRRAFRLPPIFVGRSDDYTRATAEASRQLADEQVFSPERDEFDELINRFIFPEMGIIYHRFKSNSPNTTDNQQLVKILAGAEKTGGMTPRIAREMLEQILGMDLPPFPSNFPADVPFSLTMAEAVKNMADPSEPGQQVTAIKALQAIEALTGADLAEASDEQITEVAKALAGLNNKVQEMWAKNVPSFE